MRLFSYCGECMSDIVFYGLMLLVGSFRRKVRGKKKRHQGRERCMYVCMYAFTYLFNDCRPAKKRKKSLLKSTDMQCSTDTGQSNMIAITPTSHIHTREKLANFKIEPPGLFRGRGEHPKMGLLKKRVVPEQIVINIGEGEKVWLVYSCAVAVLVIYTCAFCIASTYCM